MTVQITVRLPDDLVAFIDQCVANGDASSRASLVARAVDRERRRSIAARDAAILAASSTESDFDDLAEFAVETPMPDLA